MSADDKKRKASEMGMEDDSLVLENRRLIQENEELKAKLANSYVEHLEQEIDQLKVKLSEYEEDGSDDDEDDEESVCDGSSWSKSYFLLKQYKQEHGDCMVPRGHKQLGVWLMNVKASFKKKTLSQEKVDKLNKIGVNWGKGYPPPLSWEDRFKELKKYHDKFGHCNIHVDSNPDLMTDMAKWVVEQCKQGKRLQKMKPSAMTMDQYEKLQGLSFKWKVAKKRHS